MDTPSTTLISYAPNSQRSPTSQRARAFTPTYRQHSQESRLLTDIIGITLWPIGFGRALRILSWLARSLTNLMNHRNIYNLLGYFILKRRVDWFQSPFIPVINYICNYAFLILFFDNAYIIYVIMPWMRDRFLHFFHCFQSLILLWMKWDWLSLTCV